MMVNELIFCLQAFLIGFFALVALALGKGALIGFISINCILANLFILKQITLVGLTATCCDAYSIGAVLGLNLLQEYYGKASAQRAILISFVLLVLYTLMSCIHLSYIPHVNDTAHLYSTYIFTCIPRITGASLFVYILVQYIDSLLYAQLKLYMAENIVVRTWICIAITQLLDTVLFSFLAFYGVIDNLFHLICISYLIKLIAILIATPYVTASRWIYTKTI